ncbi:MAG: PIN domain-containing protein [Planctomycetes bacterium]|nr:PIN domain-containing protein [Planctomycetota bacterium]MBU4398477.1 PIN domain-containing protein [Planctomycetota bacterium]MCG2682883.1 PIN domain-containing protein [Planctomycetales bacterium]
MRKLSIYVETSVWSQALADDAPQLRAATEDFLAEAKRGKYDLFISEVVTEEVARASEETTKRLQELIAEHKPAFLELNEEALLLSLEYLHNGAVPPSKVDDARHVAVAVSNDLDVLVSWNYKHLVNVRRREMFHQISVMNGFYKPLQIVAPPEVTDEIQ